MTRFTIGWDDEVVDEQMVQEDPMNAFNGMKTDIQNVDSMMIMTND